MKISKNQFEGLTSAQMQWADEPDWISQAERFEDTICWSHKFIYWVESYASIVLATEFLKQNRFNFSVSYDNALDQYCFTTDYAGSWVTV